MKPMRTYHILIAAVLLAAGTTCADAQYTLPSDSIRKISLLMLQEFVTTGGESRLGFTPQNVMQARIENDSPVVFFEPDEDTLVGTSQFETFKLHLNKVMYPVKVGTRTCGSITFNRFNNNWVPREFQDSMEVMIYMKTMGLVRVDTAQHGTMLAVYLPSLHITLAVSGDINNGAVTATTVLDTIRANRFLPQTARFLNKRRIPMQEFFAKYRAHLLAEIERKKRRK